MGGSLEKRLMAVIHKFTDIVKWTPKQQIANVEADTHRLFLYGGAAGGGKSYWLRWYTLRWLIKQYKEKKLRGVQAALFCEDYPTLKDRHVGRLELELPPWMGRLKEDKAYGLCVKLDPALGNGVLMLRNLDDPGKYMSTEFGLVAIDELTKDKKEVFDNLRARLRWPGIPRPQFIAGTNPGNIGHEWVKTLWVDRIFPPEEKEPEEFGYVPAKVDDNPYVDPSYVRSLESLPDRLRKALREGSWDIAEGQFFTDFDRTVHVVDEIDVRGFPSHWARIRAIDVSGRNGHTACLWAIIDNNGDVWIYREYFSKGLDSDQHAKNIWDSSHFIDDAGQVRAENYKYTVMDTAAWAKMGLAETTAEIYLRIWQKLDNEKGVNNEDSLVPANKERVMGWDVVNQYLRHDPANGKFTGLKIMENCRNLTRCFPLVLVSEKNSNDVRDMPGIDDLLDAIRYLLVTLRDARSSDGMIPVSENFVQKKLRERKEQRQDAKYYNYDYSK
jgi:phage terminase large subunit